MVGPGAVFLGTRSEFRPQQRVRSVSIASEVSLEDMCFTKCRDDPLCRPLFPWLVVGLLLTLFPGGYDQLAPWMCCWIAELRY